MYLKYTWIAGKTVEVKKTFSARFGRKIERGIREGDTREAQRLVNYNRAIAELRRILNANFSPGDWHTIFTYPQVQPPTKEQAKRDREMLMKRCRELYRREGSELFRVAVTEYDHKRIHHHVVMNDLPGKMGEVKRLWKEILQERYYTELEVRRGEPRHLIWRWSQMDESGQYGELAAYLVKETEKTMRQPGAVHRRRYSASRNCIRPKPEIEVVDAKEWREEARERKGYYIDKNATYNGFSPVTGIPVQETVYVSTGRRKEKRK